MRIHGQDQWEIDKSLLKEVESGLLKGLPIDDLVPFTYPRLMNLRIRRILEVVDVQGPTGVIPSIVRLRGWFPLAILPSGCTQALL